MFLLFCFRELFFDSYGFPPTKEVEKFLGEGISSTFKIQEGTKYCGQMSLYVLYCMAAADAKFTDIVLSLRDECENTS